MGGFLSALFGGSNPTLNANINNVGSIAGFATSTGTKDTSTASNFYQTLLSGDQSAISKLLAPQIKEMQTQGQQKTQTASQFGNRSGGTNAGNQQTGDQSRANINDMISKLTSGAASSLGSMGQNLLGTGLQGYQLQTDMSQQRMQNWQNSLLGGAAYGGEALGFGTVGLEIGKLFGGK